MNDKQNHKNIDMQALKLMDELEAGEPISQREMASRLGIALGLVNSYLKTLVHKGFVQVKAFPRNRCAYLLTPEGFVEKSRLAYQQVSYFHKLFRTARQDSLKLFLQLKSQGVTRLSFCGVDEFTEIAYLSLCETGLSLVSVMDDQQAGELFLDLPVISLAAGLTTERHPLVLTSLRHSEVDRQQLLTLGARSTDIYGPIFGVNGLAQ